MTTPEKQYLDYTVEIKTKDPIDKQSIIEVKRELNLAIWKTLDNYLSYKIRCSVYSRSAQQMIFIQEMIKAEQDNQSSAIITDEEAFKTAYLRWRGAYNDHVWIISDHLNPRPEKR